MKEKLALYIFVISMIHLVSAQQQSSFTQFMHNRAALNPASFGEHEALSVTALSRWQWAGIEGAPQSQSLTVHTSFPDRNFSVGGVFIRDEISVTSINQVMIGGNYRIKVSNGHLNFGLQGGLQLLDADYTKVNVSAPSQDAFSENLSSSTPNFGFGLAYTSPMLYVGLSAPILLTNDIESNNDIQFTQQPYYVGMLGLTLEMSSEVKFQPNVLVNVTEGVPVSMNLNGNFVYRDLLGAGFSFRDQESVSLLVNATLMQKLNFGYSYDLIINETLQSASVGSHELRLNYRLKGKETELETKGATKNIQE